MRFLEHQGRLCAAITVLLLMVSALVACRSTKQTPSPEPVQEAQLPNVEGHGLAVRYHDTSEPLERIHEVIDDLPAERLTDESWGSHGLEIIRIREHDLGLLQSRLPSTSRPGLRWHGQALTWRNLMPPATPVGERIMVTDGQEERFPGGMVGLSGRGWSLMTLDGPRVQVELMPMIEMPGGTQGRFNHLRREYLIGPGDNLLVIAGSGQWPHPPPEDTSAEAEEEAKKTATMGQLFLELETDTGQSRRLLMVTPRFGNWLQGDSDDPAVGIEAQVR
ncbi:MAG: hypothetical protein VX527_03085 [Planctomycetota bacterium]|nr:hypothetical protein [Planctomycetota bacterium]